MIIITGKCEDDVQSHLPLTYWMYYFWFRVTGTYCFIWFIFVVPELTWGLMERPWWRCGLHRQSHPHLCLCFSLLFLICRIYLPSPQPLPPLPPVQLTSFWKRKTFIRSEAWAEAGWFLNISIKASQVADSCFYFLSTPDWAMCKADWVQHLDPKVLAPVLGSATNGFHIF